MGKVFSSTRKAKVKTAALIEQVFTWFKVYITCINLILM